ncbi:MAG: MFS transporter [Terracoccus sp.]
MNHSEGAGMRAPSYLEVLTVPRYLPIFLAGALSLWGDYIARVTIAAVVFQRTGSPLATATTLAVSLIPTFFGRSLVGPVVDRFPYKWVLIWSHLSRGACVVVLLWLVVIQAGFVWIFLALFVLELIGGASTASNMVLLTDLFEHDKHLYSRAVGLAAISEQFNQAIGFAIGGSLIAVVGSSVGLLVDLASFLIAAVVVLLVVPLRAVRGTRGKGLRGFVSDLSSATGDLVRHPVLARLVILSAAATLGIAAPEALAIPIAGENGWGGVLMASPIVGAVFGILVIGRFDVHAQNRAIIPLALAMPLPLLLTALHPPIAVVAALFFLSGTMQAFMVPLQSTFALVTRPELRGRIFSLAGSVSVAAAGVSFLVAGWLGGRNDDALAGVAVSAAITLIVLCGVAVTWPYEQVRAEVARAYDARRP